MTNTTSTQSTLLCALLALPAVSLAQDTRPPGEATVVLDPMEVRSPRADGYNVKEATVATKTATPLLDTPQSVSVLSKDFLADTAVTSIGEATRYLPGVGVAQGEGNRDTVVLRGNSSTGDYFVDGVRDDVQYYRDFYNIDRLEVLKGPAGMIFGRGGPGGILNRVTKQATPGSASFYEFSALAGSWEQFRTTFDVNQAVSRDATLRLTGVYEDAGSYRDGVALQREGLNPTAAFRLGERTVLRAGFEYFHDERVADRGIPSYQGKPLATDSSTFFGDPDRSPTDTDVVAFSASLDHAFANGATLRNSTRYATYDKFYQNVFPGAVNPAGTLVAISAYNQATDRENLFNQTDYVVPFTTGPIEHKLLLGLELGRQETDNFRATGSSSATGLASLGSVSIANPRYSGPLFFRQSATDADNHSVAEVVAVYVQDQLQLLPRLQLIAGARFDHFTVDFTDQRTGATLNTADDLVSPRAGLVFKPAERVSLYTSYTLSHVPRAGEQLAGLSVTNAALEPEQFENLEVGAKWDATDKLSFAAAAYRLDRSNQAITDPAAGNAGGPPAGTLMLVDGQQVRGFELSAAGHLTRRWTLNAGYAYQDGETQSDNGAIPSGTRIPQLPRNTFSLWNRYDFTASWGAGLGVIYRDELFAAADNTVTLPDFVRYDAALFYRFNRHLHAQLNVENLFDTGYHATAHNNTNITPGSPLAIRLGVTARF
jgi:catecholate siderophore receptor